MNNRVRVKLSVLMFSIALVVASTIHASQQQSQTEKPPAGQAPAAQPAQQQPQAETLQVLKGMPRQQIIQEMRKIAAGLGVECNFCHSFRVSSRDASKGRRSAHDARLHDGDGPQR